MACFTKIARYTGIAIFAMLFSCAVIHSASAEEWTWIPNMQEARGALESVTDDEGNIYVLGGTLSGAGPTLNSVEKYDPATNMWTYVAPMQQKRSSFAAAYADGYIYAIGGNNPGGSPFYLSSVERYSIETNTWEYIASLPQQRGSDPVAEAGNDGKIYVYGGGYHSGSSVTSMVMYDPEHPENGWVTMASMHDRRRHFSGTVDQNGHIYAIGGFESNTSMVKTIEKYDPLTNQWTYLASFPFYRCASGAACDNDGNIYAIAGASWDYSGPYENRWVEVYNPTTNTWNEIAPVNEGRHYSDATFSNGYIYILGGSKPTATMERYDPEHPENGWLLSTYNPHIVAQWHMNEGGGSTVHDSSGNNNHGTTYGGAAWTNGIAGKALNLDGTNDFIRLPGGVLNGLDTGSIELWVKPTNQIDDTSASQALFTSANMYVNSQITLIFHNTGRLFFRKAAAYDVCNEFSSVRDVWEAHTWYHIVITWSGSNMSMYINGQLDSSINNAVPGLYSVSNVAVIGRFEDFQQDYLNGTVDEVTIYNTALTPGGPPETDLRRLLRLLNNSFPYYNCYRDDYDDVIYQPGINGPESVVTSVEDVNADAATDPDVWLSKYPWTFNIDLYETGYDGNSWYRGTGLLDYTGENGITQSVSYKEFVIRPMEILHGFLPGDGFGIFDLLDTLNDSFHFNLYNTGWYPRAPLLNLTDRAEVNIHNAFGAHWPILQLFGLPDTVNSSAVDTYYYDPTEDALKFSGETFRMINLPMGFSGGFTDSPLFSGRIPLINVGYEIFAEYTADLTPALGLKIQDDRLGGLIMGGALDLAIDAKAEFDTGGLPAGLELAGSGDIDFFVEVAKTLFPGVSIRSLYEDNMVFDQIEGNLPVGRLKILPIYVAGSYTFEFFQHEIGNGFKQTFLEDSFEYIFGNAIVRVGSPINLIIYDAEGYQSGYDESSIIEEIEQSFVDQVNEEILLGPNTRHFTVVPTGNLEASPGETYDLTVIFPVLIDSETGDRIIRHIEYQLRGVQTYTGETDYIEVDIDKIQDGITQAIRQGLDPDEAVDYVFEMIDADEDDIPDIHDSDLIFDGPPVSVFAENAVGVPGKDTVLKAMVKRLDQPEAGEQVDFDAFGGNSGSAITDIGGIAETNFSIPAGTPLGFARLTASCGSKLSIATLYVYNNPPQANAGGVQEYNTPSTQNAVVTLDGSASTDEDSTTGTNDHIISFKWYENGVLLGEGETINVEMGAGVHKVDLQVTDAAGATGEDTAIIRVNTLPVANAGSDQTFEATGSPIAVTLDGSGSYDPDEGDAIQTYTWYDEENSVIATGMTPEVQLDLGAHHLTLVVNDGDADSEIINNGTDEDSVVVISIQDTIPPEVSVSLRPDTLWPPNHKMHEIQAEVQTSDVCDPNPMVILTSVESNEPDDAQGGGDGKTVNDIQGADIDTEDYSFLVLPMSRVTAPGLPSRC